MGNERYAVGQNGENPTKSGSSENDKGCRLTACTGFVLILLATAVAIAVGVSVHFAEKGEKEVKCICTMQDFKKNQVEACKTLAQRGTSDVCSVCPSSTSSPSQHISVPSSSARSSLVATVTTPSVANRKNIRLPKTLLPVHYDLEMQPDMYGGDPSLFSFHGSVRIVFLCLEATDVVILHVKKLDIMPRSILVGSKSRGDNSSLYDSHRIDTDRQFLIVHLNRKVTKGDRYYIQMNFSGPLKNDLAGLYVSSYQRENKTVYLATTQFEATDARKAFPCFDEPAMKAHFNITLVRKKGLTSISNMPRIKTETRGNDMEADIFSITPPISSYLVAFVISDFVNVSDITKNGIEYRVWGRREAQSQLSLALDVGVKVITYYEEYFNISFPLPKQDMVAIPDFGMGAMENWGLITYRESRLLYDKGTSSNFDTQQVVEAIAHELAHQWFGDLVSPAWWDDLWLNEGFANFVAYIGSDFFAPNFKMHEQFVVTELQKVFNADGLVTSHPVYVDVQSPDEIQAIFDSISYSKGGSVLRMLRFFIGEETFKNGLSRYLMSRSYSNANHTDLWIALDAQAQVENKNINVVEIMKTWTLQMNYPVVMVTRKGTQKLGLAQQRFLLDPDATDPRIYVSEFGYKWDIPFTFTTSEKKYFTVSDQDIHWMWKDKDSVTFDTTDPVPNGPDGWVLGNILQYGYYRVNYDDANWKALTRQLKSNHTVIHPINRAQIINDAWNLARSGLLKQEIALETLEYLENETQFVPWKAARLEMDSVEKMLRYTDIYGAFQEFVKTISSTPFQVLGFNDTGASQLDSFTRKEVSGAACGSGVLECVKEATELFTLWKKNPSNNPISPQLRYQIYCAGISSGTADDWSFVYDRYKQETSLSEKDSLMLSLACSKEPWILRMLLKRAITPSEIRKAESTRVIYSVTENPTGQPIVWDFLRENWDLLLSDFSSTINYFVKVIIGSTSTFNSQFQVQQIRDFVKSQSNLGHGARAFQQAIEKAQGNTKWIGKNYPIIKAWLTNLGYLK